MIFLWLVLLLSYAGVSIISPLSGTVVPTESYTFSASAYWRSSPGNTAASPPTLNCLYNIVHGGGAITGSVSNSWSCHIDNGGTPSNTSDDTKVCSADLTIPVSGLSPGLGGWSINCGSVGSDSTGAASCSWLDPTSCILYDFEEPNIIVANPIDGNNYPGPNIPLEYTAEDDNPEMICKVYLDDAWAVPLFEHKLESSKIKTFTEVLENIPWGSHKLLIKCEDITRKFPSPNRVAEKTINFKRWIPVFPEVHLITPVDDFTTNNTDNSSLPGYTPIIFRFWVNNSATDLLDCKIVLKRNDDTVFYVINDVVNTTDPTSPNIMTYNNSSSTMGDGKYDWYVNCTDQGPLNTGKSEVRTFWIDRDPPYKLEMIPPNGSAVSDLPFELKYRVFDLVSTKLNCELTSDFGISDTREVNQGEWNSITVSSITSGNHTWNVVCYDVAGNEISQSYVFTYQDILPPYISLIRPFPGSISSPGTIQFRFTVNDASPYTCKLWIKPSTGSFSVKATLSGSGSQTFDVPISIPDIGNYEWKVTCQDSYGNDAESAINYFAVKDISSGDSSAVGAAICASQPFQSQIKNVTLLLLVIGLSMAVFGILFGNLFGAQRTVEMSKAEVKSLFVTGALFAVLVAASSSLCGFIQERLINGWANLSSLIDKLEQPTFISAMIYGKSLYISGLSSPQYQMNIPYVDITYKKNIQKIPFDYMQDVKGILDLLMNVAGSYAFYDRFVSYLVMFSMQVLMYLGLMLRMTPFTRRYGTTILALSITLIFILPLVYEATANILHALLSDAIITISSTLSYVHGIIDKYFITIYTNIKGLREAANIFNLLHLIWAAFHIFALIMLRFAEYFPPALPAAISQVYGVSSIIYQAFLSLAGFIWTAILINTLSTMGGSVGDVPDLYGVVIGVFQQLAFINIMSIFFYVVNLLIVLGVTRSLSLLGGGDYFLYGVEDHI